MWSRSVFMRIKFPPKKQRKFLQEVLKNSNIPSLRELSKRIGVSYSTLKNYFIEDRTLPENLFNDLCYLANINSNKLNVKILEDNWGKVKGGKS